MSAIRNVSSDDGYESRDAAPFERRAGKTPEFKAYPGTGAGICGVCVKECPFGKKQKGGTHGENRNTHLF